MRNRPALQKFSGLVTWSEERAALRIFLAGNLSRLLMIMMPAEKRGAERATGVARGRLDPDFLERSLAEHSAVAYTIERDAAGQTKMARARQRVGMARHPQHHFLSHRLDRASEVHVPLRQRCLRFSRWPAHEPVEFAIGHREARHEIEVAQVEPERAIVSQINQLRENEIAEGRFAVRCETHHFVFAGVDAKTEVVSERGIEQTE